MEKYGPSDVTVLLEGETGCGKELVAGQLHLHSNRSDSEMVVVSGAELNSHLGQDALFGHTHGAYTGTARDREGFVKAADHGTLFLDDVSDLSPEVQPLLLRFLETGDFMRLGSDERQRVDVRVIAATNHNLSELIKQGKIRSDLYYRLQVATIKVPPLRDRREDIPLLVEHFARRQSIRLLGREITLDAECVDHFISRNWPGNVRELRNAVIRVILTHGAREKITSSEVRAVLDQESGGTPVMHGTLGELETEFRRDCIIHALNVAGGNITRAAETLGVDRARLSRLISEFNLRDFARHLAE
ncbi:MAG: sigma 54-interacting transcriptional regulator [candidate division Zixibacteria bacterium]|nr:sigma 54-interacting transcriptional regulator [candidate division Zixibacteria bacterium]